MDPALEIEIQAVAYFAYSLRSSEVSGITTYVSALRRGLTAHGVRSRILTHFAESGDPDAVLLPDPPLLRRAAELLEHLRPGTGRRLYRRALIAWQVRALERREHLSVIEIEETAGIAGWLLRSRPSAPVIIRLHGPHFLVAGSNGTAWDRRARATDAAERACLARASAVSAPSRHVLEQVRQHWGLTLPGAAVVPNPTPTVAAADRWAGRGGGPILFVGRFDRTKGADLVVRAFRDLAPRFPKHEIWLVGPERQLHDGGCVYGVADFLAAELPDLSVRSRVKFLGPRTPLEIADYRRRCSCVVVASRFETFCMTATEAMMAGCPLVVSNAGALPEIVEDGATGLLFESGDPLELSRAIERLLSNEHLANRLGSAGYRSAMERYTPEIVAERMIGFYRDVVRASREARRAGGVVEGVHSS